MLPAPRRLADITPAWLTAALAQRHPGAVVAKCDVGAVVDGTNRRAGVELCYEAGAGPSAVFVKCQGRLHNRLALIALGALMTEARLAEAAVDLPLEHARLIAGTTERRRLRMAVVMTDVTALGGTPNAATRRLSVDEVRDGLRGLASLHAAFWDRPVPPSLAFLGPWVLKARWAPVSAANLLRALRRLTTTGHRGLLGDGFSVRSLEAEFRGSAALAATGPCTVLHGDPHPGNTYALPGSRTGFYDWQLARVGNWSHDVGYFMVSSLAVEDRRECEQDLLAGYLAALQAAGAAAPNRDVAWERYRATPSYGLGAWLHTFGAGSFQPDDVSLATIERFAAAHRDLDTGHSLLTG